MSRVPLLIFEDYQYVLGVYQDSQLLMTLIPFNETVMFSYKNDSIFFGHLASDQQDSYIEACLQNPKEIVHFDEESEQFSFVSGEWLFLLKKLDNENIESRWSHFFHRSKVSMGCIFIIFCFFYILVVHSVFSRINLFLRQAVSYIEDVREVIRSVSKEPIIFNIMADLKSLYPPWLSEFVHFNEQLYNIVIFIEMNKRIKNNHLSIQYSDSCIKIFKEKRNFFALIYIYRSLGTALLLRD